MEGAEASAMLVELRRKRQTLKGKLTRLLNGCGDPQATTEDKSVRASRADDVFNEFEIIQQQIEGLVTETEVLDEERHRVEVENKHLAIKSIALGAERNVSISANENSPRPPESEINSAVQQLVESQASINQLMQSLVNTQLTGTQTPEINRENQHRQVSRHELRLPAIQIPEFDGQALEWLRFRDLFDSMINARASISNAEKLEYLHTKLKGDALSLIRHIKPTNENFTMAWELLKNKYDKSEKIKHVYLALLLEQPNVKIESIPELKRLYNGVNEAYNALKVLGEPVSQWNSILIFLLEKRLDDKTAGLWYRDKRQDEDTTFQQFLSFIDKRIFELESSQREVTSVIAKDKPVERKQARVYTVMPSTCVGCGKNHALYQCEKFISMNINERRDLAKMKHLCFNCLQPNCSYRSCKSSMCRKCGGKHNTMLHVQPQPTNQCDSPSSKVVNSNTMQKQRTHVLLPTAIIKVEDISGKLQPCRALLDSGSQTTLISESCVQRLRLERKQDKTTLFGINNNSGAQAKGKVQLSIHPNVGNDINTEALCLPNLTQFLPAWQITDEKLNFFKNLNLADKHYQIPSKVDIILGADVYMNCCLTEKLTHPSGSPTAFNTVFGWALIGNVHISEQNTVLSYYVSEHLDQQLQRFWEIEEVPSTEDHLTPEEEAAEQHFIQTTTQDKEGRYIVKLPFKNQIIELGSSRVNALKRLYAMERKFKLYPNIHKDYQDFMDQYIQLGHMELVDKNSSVARYFLPHHAVFKENSSTTKLRVVFDASCKTSSGKSLNDMLMVGAKQQQDIFDILIKFRKFEFGFVGDIAKMYRQIWIHPQDRQWQSILWRKSEDQEVQEYQLKTVTYGTSSAPFLATRTLMEVAIKNQEEYPMAAKAIQENFYVDDLMCCAPFEAQAIQLKDDIDKLLSKAGLELRKWASNSKAVLETIKPENREQSLETVLDQVNTLGLVWNTQEDEFKYNVSLPPIHENITKRTVLSELSKIYDPLGWLAPMVIRLKIFMQQLWLKGVGWDEPLTNKLYNEWAEFRISIDAVKNVKIPRWIKFNQNAEIQLHGFSDASELAYAAAIYARVILQDGKIEVNLLAAKTRVAPVNQISLPRLELCAAHLLAKLMARVKNTLNIPNAEYYGWSDSTVVLAWLSDHPRRWKSFIANRTSQIINVIPAQRWHHIRSQHNPADLATRGMWADTLINKDLWWHGPAEINETSIVFTPFSKLQDDTKLEERKVQVVHAVMTQETKAPEIKVIHKFSNFEVLNRVVAWMKRFTRNCQVSKIDRNGRVIGPLSTTELLNARKVIIRLAQQEDYAKEIKFLKSNKQLPTTHRLTSLAPFVDNEGLLRVGGRIDNAPVKYDQKHPYILNQHNHVTKILIKKYHLKYLHAGKRLLHCLLNLTYWIEGVTYAIRQCIYKCTVCMRQRAQPYKQMMGKLPPCRLEMGLTFNHVGIDFAGPFQTRTWKGRGAKTYKSWLAVFVCMVTKAIHLEVVSELTSAAFIATMRRFCARRGLPSNIYTDNGTNFVGANSSMKELYLFLSDDKAKKEISRELTNDEITWHFSPPAGPHFGGMWEAGVKSAKFHMKRVLGDSILTYEEMTTVLCQIEGCLNSRPLCIKYEGDLNPLTPAHFTILRPMSAVIDEKLTNIKENRLTRWQHIQKLVQHFWQRWSVEYLNQLQQRAKWSTAQPNITLNTVVLIKEDNLAPSQWVLGRIIKTHPGKDELIRVVTVKTTKGELIRPIIKLCPLYVDL